MHQLEYKVKLVSEGLGKQKKNLQKYPDKKDRKPQWFP